MAIESNHIRKTTECFWVQITNPLLYDRLQTLSAEYSISEDMLVNVAIKRLIDEVDFIRSLRTGNVELE